MFTVLATVQQVQTTTHFLWLEKDYKKRSFSDSVSLLVLIMSLVFCGCRSGLSDLEKRLWEWGTAVPGESKRPAGRQPQRHDSTSFSPPSSSSPKLSPSKMWLKLEFPLAGEAEKQENRGRGRRESKRQKDQQLSVYTAKAFISSSLSPPPTSRPVSSTQRWAFTDDRQDQQITPSSYKVRLERPFWKSVSVLWSINKLPVVAGDGIPLIAAGDGSPAFISQQKPLPPLNTMTTVFQHQHP